MLPKVYEILLFEQYENAYIKLNKPEYIIILVKVKKY